MKNKEQIETEEKKEDFRELQIGIKKPDKVHGFEIYFEIDNEAMCAAYNAAINEICNEEKEMGVFHQTGRGNQSGYHAWEFLKMKPDKEFLTKLLPEIHKKAKELFEKFKE